MGFRYIILMVLSILVSSNSAKADWVRLDENKISSSFEFQSTPVWCWAATIELALNYYGFDISQNEIVTRTYGAAVPTTANWLQITNNLNFKAQTSSGQDVLVSATVYVGSPSAEVVVNHLKEDKPIIMAYTNPSTFTGHAIAITGVDYGFIGDKAIINSLEIRDPFPYNAASIANGGKYIIPNTITPTHMWLISATEEN